MSSVSIAGFYSTNCDPYNLPTLEFSLHRRAEIIGVYAFILNIVEQINALPIVCLLRSVLSAQKSKERFEKISISLA